MCLLSQHFPAPPFHFGMDRALAHSVQSTARVFFIGCFCLVLTQTATLPVNQTIISSRITSAPPYLYHWLHVTCTCCFRLRLIQILGGADLMQSTDNRHKPFATFQHHRRLIFCQLLPCLAPFSPQKRPSSYRMSSL
jgi:hypothetical protein